MSDGLVSSGAATGRRFLLIVRAGDGSLHRNWIADRRRRNFDLLVSYFGTVKDRYRADADHYHAMAGPRWPAHSAICRDNPALIAAYDHVGFACDDLDATSGIWRDLFRLCAGHALDLAQPAILGPITYPHTAPVETCLYRRTTYVEVMCPVFSRRALAVCSPSFSESVSGWGLGQVWAKRLAERDWPLVIVDATPVTHTRPVRHGTLYGVLSDLGIDPMVEKNDVMRRHGIEAHDIRELSRVDRPLRKTVLERFLSVAGRWRRPRSDR